LPLQARIVFASVTIDRPLKTGLPTRTSAPCIGAAACRPWKTSFAPGRQLAAPEKQHLRGGGNLPPLAGSFLFVDL
jgi:hypothetical protein